MNTVEQGWMRIYDIKCYLIIISWKLCNPSQVLPCLALPVTWKLGFAVHCSSTWLKSELINSTQFNSTQFNSIRIKTTVINSSQLKSTEITPRQRNKYKIKWVGLNKGKLVNKEKLAFCLLETLWVTSGQLNKNRSLSHNSSKITQGQEKPLNLIKVETHELNSIWLNSI